MSKILYEVYKNDIKDSESVMYGKWYARLKSIETLTLTKLAKHISEHGSVFTEDVVEGVLKKFKTCLIEMLLDSKKVKIAGLGTFYLTCECTKGGADKEADFNVKEHLKALHIRFLPDQTAEDNLSSREFIKKAEFVNVKNLLSGNTDEEGDDEENGGDDNGGSTSNGGSSQNSGSNSGNSGSGSVTPSVSAPTFSGATQFEESTQVSMSGPTGAEIRYTTDGTQPTAQSTLYTEPITLSETTVVKAIAIKDGQSSAVTSRTYTKGGNAGGGEGSGDME